MKIIDQINPGMPKGAAMNGISHASSPIPVHIGIGHEI
jgi:hypothetical protein